MVISNKLNFMQKYNNSPKQKNLDMMIIDNESITNNTTSNKISRNLMNTM